MRTFLAVLRDGTLLLIRLILGTIMVLHGWHRWAGGIDQQIELLTRQGIGFAQALAWTTTVFELIGGVLLIFGLLTPLIGAAVLAQNVLVIVLIRWPEGFWLPEGFEYNLALAGLGLVLLAYGAGRTGVDQLFLSPAESAG